MQGPGSHALVLIGHCCLGGVRAMIRYLPREKLSPAEAEEVLGAKAVVYLFCTMPKSF